jgi:2-iminobutanoate/2-iminopropanoate deaminase
MKQVVTTNTAPAAVGPYSQAVKANGMVYVSGQIAPTAGDVVAQTQQVILQLQAILKAAGSDLDQAVRVTVFMKDLAHFGAMNEVYSTMFTEPFAARVTVQVAALPKDALVEIDCVATYE